MGTKTNGGSGFAVAVVMALAVAVLLLVGDHGRKDGSTERLPPDAPALDVDSTNLSRTRIVATLDAPVLPGTNLIWCASFQLAWKEWAAALKEEQPMVEGADALCRQLNAAPNPRKFLPPGSCYAAAGEVKDGVVGRIQQAMHKTFPSVRLPEMGGFRRDEGVAYGFLEAGIPFQLPYIDSDKPVPFRESRWLNPKVKTFGIGHSKTTASPELRKQVSIVWEKWARDEPEFALDLDRNSAPCQLIVARLAPKATLAAMVQFLETRMAKPSTANMRKLGSHDTLLVPEMHWRIFHHFAELENGHLMNSSRRGDRLKLAAQSVAFRLDRSGAALQSQAILHHYKSKAQNFEFDRPFLVILQKRGADQPFFVAWIDNAELLRQWE